MHITGHRAPKTFTSYRILFLLLSLCIPVAGMWIGIHSSPNGDQLFRSTIDNGQVVVQADLVPGVTIR